MPKLSPLSFNEPIKRLNVPKPHSRKEIGIDLLIRILKQAGITREEWLRK